MPRPKTARTIALEAIASKAGFTTKHAAKLHRDGMPLDLPGAMAWLSNRPDPGTDAVGPDDDSPAALRRERIRLLALQSEKAQLALEITRGEYIAREQVATYLLQAGTSLAVFLKRYEREIPQVCNGLSLPKALDAAKKKSDELRELWAQAESEFWTNHPTE